MTREWVAEAEVDRELAAALVGEQFPGLAGEPAGWTAFGWDNTVHQLGGWVFRFPRRYDALPRFRHELAVLPVLGPRLPVPVPVPELLGRPGPRFPWEFAGCRLLPGRELAEAGPAGGPLPDTDRVPVAAALGAFLRELHAPGTLAAVEAAYDLPVDPVRRGDAATRARGARERLGRLAAAGIRPDPALDQLLAAAEASPRSGPSARVVSHGDLHLRHLLVDAGRLVGVLDWGDVCLADPCVDLSIGYAAFTGPARQAFWAAYGDPPDAARELAARTLAVFLCAALAEMAVSLEDRTLLTEVLAGLDRAVG